MSSTTGVVLVAAAGTSDLPVAEEAAVTASALGSTVQTVYDVGVAGLHRLLDQYALLAAARVIVVVAGMEGALPSVVGGLVDKPVIAVPTSVGYGAHFHGLAPLLAMLNSCAAGIAVVNIDNGFGAGYMAHSINLIGETAAGSASETVQGTLDMRIAYVHGYEGMTGPLLLGACLDAGASLASVEQVWHHLRLPTAELSCTRVSCADAMATQVTWTAPDAPASCTNTPMRRSCLLRAE